MADAFEPGVFTGCEARLIAFRGVIYDARRLGTPLRLSGVNIDDGGGPALVDGVKHALLIRRCKPIVDSQPVAVRFEIVSLIHQPDIGNCVVRGCVMVYVGGYVGDYVGRSHTRSRGDSDMRFGQVRGLSGGGFVFRDEKAS